MSENVFQRIDFPGDPEQCQAVGKTGQCPYKRIPGAEYCPRHGGNKVIEAKTNEAIRTFRLGQWQQRVNEFADDGQIKSLREEIGITRLLLEKQIQACTNDVDLLINSHKISDLVMKMEKLITSCHNMELKMGMLLDRTAILQLGSMIVEVISQAIEDSDAREAVSEQILNVIATTVIKKES